jgi:hypothetical protein
MNISKETPKRTEQRLLKVIAGAQIRVFDRSFAFEEFKANEFQQRARPDALAFVRDDAVWSQLVPSDDQSKELFRVFSFHFEENLDNSGFVGWLASKLKRKLGTGIFVVCGQNTNKGGIFDYWGCPIEIGDAVIKEVNVLMGKA